MSYLSTMAFGVGFVACKYRKYHLDVYYIVVSDSQIRIEMCNNDKYAHNLTFSKVCQLLLPMYSLEQC